MVTPAMLFRTGSINKMPTAAVLVALADEGKIRLDAPLAKSVPGLAPGLSRVTADQLLSHTAGLIDPARVCCAQDEGALSAQVRAYRDEDYFITEPGRIFSYSNTGYIIAGFLIEQLSGELLCRCDAAPTLWPAGDDAYDLSPHDSHDVPAVAGARRGRQG
jgi:D-alanyl-D-alanine carboxypeptidase